MLTETITNGRRPANRSRAKAGKSFSEFGGRAASQTSRHERWRLPVYPPDYPQTLLSPTPVMTKANRGGQIARFAIFATLLTWLLRLFPPRP